MGGEEATLGPCAEYGVLLAGFRRRSVRHGRYRATVQACTSWSGSGSPSLLGVVLVQCSTSSVGREEPTFGRRLSDVMKRL